MFRVYQRPTLDAIVTALESEPENTLDTVVNGLMTALLHELAKPAGGDIGQSRLLARSLAGAIRNAQEDGR